MLIFNCTLLFSICFSTLKVCEIEFVNLATVIFTKYLEIHCFKRRRHGVTNTFDHRLYMTSLLSLDLAVEHDSRQTEDIHGYSTY